MNKSLFTYFAEAYIRYCADRRESPAEGAIQSPGRLARLVRWLMPNGGTLVLITLLIATQSVWARSLASPTAPGPSATTVNYQGRLADSGGSPVPDGTYGMSFALYDASSGGNLVWGPESHTAVPVKSGLFSVGLGSQTSGGIPTTTWNGDRYLEITVGGETLSPRELIRSVPIAGMALTVPDGAITGGKIEDGAVTRAKLASDIKISGLYLFDDPPIVLTTESQFVDPTGSWDTLDLSSWVPADAQSVILTILVDIDRENDAEFRLGFRKPGSTAAAWHVLGVDGHYTPGPWTWTHNQGVVGVENSSVEWGSYRTGGSLTLGRYYVTLVGYYR